MPLRIDLVQRLLLTVMLMCGLSSQAQAADILVKVLFKNNVIIEVDGERKRLKTGDSFAGITLLSADSEKAVVDVQGERKTLRVGRRIGTNYRDPEKTTVRINRQQGGHFFTPGRINNRPVTFLVDTGATSIAMNSQIARELGINYRDGRQQMVQTASGMVSAYSVTLHSVAVGSLTLQNVEAGVLEGSFPMQILLGNSYLNRVNMQVDDGVLILQAKF
jgi:aspartyl protease family protein